MRYLGNIEEYRGHKDPNTLPRNKRGYAVRKGIGCNVFTAGHVSRIAQELRIL